MHRIFLLLAWLLAPVSQAQEVYKVIGADGKITFTDRPPPASSTQSVKPFGTRPAIGNSPAAAQVQSRHVEAALQVYYKQIIVHSAKELCGQLGAIHRDTAGATAASTAAAEAATRWQERHAALAQQKNVVLHDQLTQAELLKLSDGARVENNKYLSQTMAAPVADRIAWCQRMPKTLASLEFDLASNPDVVRKIIDYKPVKHGLQSGARR